MGVVDCVWQGTSDEERSDLMTDSRTYRIPVRLEEARRETVWPRRLVGVDGKNGVSDLDIRGYGDELIIHIGE